MHELHVPINADRIGGRGGDHEMILGESRRCAVVHGDAVFAQHQSIARLTHRQLFKPIGVHQVQKFRGVAALNIDLA